MTAATTPATTIKAGKCAHCDTRYDWPDGDPYDGDMLCTCQCQRCGVGNAGGDLCEFCSEEESRTVTDAFTATIIRQIGNAVDIYVLAMADGRSLKDLYAESLFLDDLQDREDGGTYELLATALDHVDWGHVAEETVEAYMARHSTGEA